METYLKSGTEMEETFRNAHAKIMFSGIIFTGLSGNGPYSELTTAVTILGAAARKIA